MWSLKRRICLYPICYGVNLYSSGLAVYSGYGIISTIYIRYP